MKNKDIMSHDPVCCVADDTAQDVAKIMCEGNVGSVPVVKDQQSRKLIGMITDRENQQLNQVGFKVSVRF